VLRQQMMGFLLTLTLTPSTQQPARVANCDSCTLPVSWAASALSREDGQSGCMCCSSTRAGRQPCRRRADGAHDGADGVQDTKYFDSADWALGKEGGGSTAQAPLQPKLEVSAFWFCGVCGTERGLLQAAVWGVQRLGVSLDD